MANYIDKVQNMLENSQNDAVVLKSATMKKYLNTLTGSGCQIVITKDKGYLFLDGRYLEEAKEREHDLEIHLIQENAISDISKTLKACGCRKLALEDASTSVKMYQAYAQEGFELSLWSDELGLLRIRKEEEEIQKIQLAVDMADEILVKVKDKIHIGMSENEISALLHYYAISMGAQKMSFDTIVSSGPRTALPHGRPTNRKISAHEPIMMDFGVQLNNYQSDITRMVFIGKPSDKMLDIYNTIYEAQTTALASIREGMTGQAVDAVARDIITKRGYGEYFGHGLGHGIGIGDGCEFPMLNQSSTTILKENMLMSCEPGVYVPGVGGVRIEDDVLIKNGVGVALNKTSKELCILKEK